MMGNGQPHGHGPMPGAQSQQGGQSAKQNVHGRYSRKVWHACGMRAEIHLPGGQEKKTGTRGGDLSARAAQQDNALGQQSTQQGQAVGGEQNEGGQRNEL